METERTEQPITKGEQKEAVEFGFCVMFLIVVLGGIGLGILACVLKDRKEKHR